MSERIAISPSFEEVVEPIAEEMEQTANQVVEQRLAAKALDDVLGLELSVDTDTTPIADDTLSCTNPSCKCQTCLH